MTKRTWENLGKRYVIPSLGGKGLSIGKLIILCGRLAKLPITVNRPLTEEYFQIFKFNENNNPFTTLLGKPWIERD
jgi:hypothetical protein